MIFIDTNLIVAASYETHPHHTRCLSRFAYAMRTGGACSLHIASETFSALTSLPLPLRFPPRQAMDIINRAFEYLQPITLTPAEHLAAIRELALRGLTGGVVYDALHMACARKAGATEIYTMNIKHFKIVAPDLADRIFEA